MQQATAALFLILAIGLSWPRFIQMFTAAQSDVPCATPISMMASAISISSVALAISQHGLPAGALLLMIGIAAGIAMHAVQTTGSIISAAVSMAIYLQLTSTHQL
jgi:hypothetical protein